MGSVPGSPGLPSGIAGAAIDTQELVLRAGDGGRFAGLLARADVPTGAFADLLGRRRSYVLGASLRVVAFLLYFRLIADVGATRALTVTFLIPVFGVLWGWLFLGEALPAGMLGGGVLIVAGTALVTRG